MGVSIKNADTVKKFKITLNSIWKIRSLNSFVCYLESEIKIELLFLFKKKKKLIQKMLNVLLKIILVEKYIHFKWYLKKQNLMLNKFFKKKSKNVKMSYCH